jgi:hypothetical protein
MMVLRERACQSVGARSSPARCDAIHPLQRARRAPRRVARERAASRSTPSTIGSSVVAETDQESSRSASLIGVSSDARAKTACQLSHADSGQRLEKGPQEGVCGLRLVLAALEAAQPMESERTTERLADPPAPARAASGARGLEVARRLRALRVGELGVAR